MSEAEELMLLERQAKVIQRQAGLLQRMDAELAEAKTRIKEHCKNCWAFRGKDPAQCRTCALHPYKEPERWKTELVGNWDEVTEE